MNEAITIVSGLPRSGTSMMMRMLEAGGMEVVVDNIRKADEDNPLGYYEFESVKQVKKDASWLDSVQGKAVKMVSMLLYDLPMQKKYKIIIMLRKIEEILASQRKMLQRTGQTNVLDDREMAKSYIKHLDEIKKWLEGKQNIDMLYLEYNDLIENAEVNAKEINRFFGNVLDMGKMVQIVDSSLYRQRASLIGKADLSDENLKNITEMTLKDQEKEKIEEQLRSLGYM